MNSDYPVAWSSFGQVAATKSGNRWRGPAAPTRTAEANGDRWRLTAKPIA